MSTCSHVIATYTFGPFSINSSARLLFREAERVPLPPKAADVLIALLEREGQLVTKDELLKEVWPDTFVEEGNLARHIFLLRKTLGGNLGRRIVCGDGTKARLSVRGPRAAESLERGDFDG
jgi:DNA-binding winged helix-turn-helix (wHTH) protein